MNKYEIGDIQYSKSFTKSITRILITQKYQIISFALLFGLGLVLLYPMYFGVLGSLSTKAEFDQTVFLPIPKNPLSQISNYFAIFSQPGLIKALAVTMFRIYWGFAVGALTAVLGGYAFAKMNFPFRRTIFIFLLSTMMIPGVAMMIPGYIWMVKFPLIGGNDIFGVGGRGFIDNPLLYFVTGWVSTYNIFLFRQAFVGTGKELGESAQIDGAKFLYIVFRIYLPLVKPLLVVLFLGSAFGAWNDYMTNLIMLPNRPEWNSIGYATIGLADYYASTFNPGGADFPKAYAINVLMMFPPIILFVFLQKQFVEGLSAGAIKG